MTVISAEALKLRFEAGDTPTAQDFIDLIDSFLMTDQSNFPNPLPAVSAQNLTNIPVPTGATINVAEFNDLVQVPSYLSSKSFLVSGNLVSQFPPNRRIRLTLTPVPLVTQVDAATYDVGQDNTTVTIIDAMPNTTVSKVSVATVNPLAANGSVSQNTVGFTRGANLTAAATLDTGTLHYSFDVDGTTGISAIAQRPPGTFIRLRFTGSVTLTHSATLQLIGDVNYTTNPGDTLEFEAQSLGWRQVGVLIDPDLYAIANLGGVEGLLRKTAANTWALDTSQVGSIAFVAKNAAPAGFLKANGAVVSRATYATLFAVIGTTFGAGDGVTTFQLPDLRGEFVRGWDDGRGVDSGRAFGSAQSQDIQTHSNDVGVLTGNVAGAPYNPGNKLNNATYATSDGAAYTTAYFNTTYLSASGQTRPRNIALLACIRYM